jgi:protein-S-isoprenylcysteine O-methyltransferase Ste14
VITRRKRIIARIVLAALLGAAVGARLAHWHAPAWMQPFFVFPWGMRIALAELVAFSIYWSIAARHSAETQSSESVASRQFHLWMVNLASLVLIFHVPGLTARFIPEDRAFVVIGLLLEAAFLLLAVWSRRHLGENWAGEVRIASGHQLVRSGPYRLVRHPIYTGVLGAYCAIALVSGEMHALLALPIFFFAYWRKIAMEERAMAATFGPEHASYQHDSWKLVPWIY